MFSFCAPLNTWRILLVAGFCFFLTACAGNRIDLTYNPVGVTMPSENLSIQIPDFTSKLSSPRQIGAKSNGETFEATDSPTAWVSQALTEELVRSGVQASYIASGTSNGPVVLTGTLDRLRIEQVGSSEYKVKIAITVQLINKTARTTFKQSFNAEQNTYVLPTDKNLAELMESTLRDVVVPAALAIKSKL